MGRFRYLLAMEKYTLCCPLAVERKFSKSSVKPNPQVLLEELPKYSRPLASGEKRYKPWPKAWDFPPTWPLNPALGLPATFYGTFYSPFSNIVCSCSSFLRLVNFPPVNQQITINNIEVTGKSLNCLCDIFFDASFFAGRNTLLSSSQISIIFTNAGTISNSRCDIWTPQ